MYLATAETKMIKVCPKCGSIHVNWIAGGVAGAVYKCDDCQYVGAFILEVRADQLDRFQKEMKEGQS